MPLYTPDDDPDAPNPLLAACIHEQILQRAKDEARELDPVYIEFLGGHDDSPARRLLFIELRVREIREDRDLMRQAEEDAYEDAHWIHFCTDRIAA